MITSQFLVQLGFIAVMICWFAFAAAFIFRKRPPKAVEKNRNRSATYGILLQMAGYASVWSFRRAFFTPLFSENLVVTTLVTGFSLLLAVGSVWLVLSSVRALGKQWSLSARVVEDHQLITTGPYRIVRNPIYTGMFGMLVATGLNVSQLSFLVVAIVLFLIGTSIRIRSEETLLREAFGQRFNEYACRVPAFVPGIPKTRASAH